MKSKYSLVFLFLCAFFSATAQQAVLKDPEIIHLIHQSYDSIYNMNFESADATLNQLNQRTPGHPVYPILRAMYYYWKHMPMSVNNPDYEAFTQSVHLGAQRADRLLEEDEDNPEGIFFGMSAHAMLAMQYSEDRSYLKAVKEAKTAYYYMRKGFDREDEFPEFYFSSGIYNFYREQYPESHPAYRSFTWIFTSGDKELGIQQMKEAAARSTFIHTEAKTYLSHIYLRYMDDPQQASIYAGDVIRQYPKNPAFQTLYVESLLFSGQYGKAQPIVEKLLVNENPYYRMSGEFFQAYIYEKENANLYKASRYYKKALKTDKEIAEDLWTYRSFVYAGMARIEELKGNSSLAAKNYEKALKLARYEPVRKEAQAYLDR